MNPRSEARFRLRRRTKRGSPSKGLPSGWRTSQNMRATALSRGRHGINSKVDGSGMAIMSDSSMRANPSIDEPSKPVPSSSACSSSCTVIETLFRVPRMSVNQRRMNLTSCSLATWRT